MSNKDLENLHNKMHNILVEVEIALDTNTYPDWLVVKDRLLESLELVKKLERDQIWNKLGGKK
ncbi:MAG: hypothetical protein HY819_00730 [Acidobacteria bacterium]|nr:hypothetical protein [Acidobacteriota bacterium]